jgi:hypothetical protein
MAHSNPAKSEPARRRNGSKKLVQGTASSEIIRLEAGYNTVNAGHGFDTVIGGVGNDSLNGGGGRDRLEGGWVLINLFLTVTSALPPTLTPSPTSAPLRI